MTTQHTPGAWQALDRIVCHDRGYLIATCPDVIDAPANARLIAAAPELLEALREYVERHEAEGASPGLPEYDQACAALAKAEGR